MAAILFSILCVIHITGYYNTVKTCITRGLLVSRFCFVHVMFQVCHVIPCLSCDPAMSCHWIIVCSLFTGVPCLVISLVYLIPYVCHMSLSSIVTCNHCLEVYVHSFCFMLLFYVKGGKKNIQTALMLEVR